MAAQLGDRIRELRLAHPIYKSLRHFADQLGKSPSWVSKLERNLEKPGRDTLQEIARMLGADADELFALADQIAPDVEQTILTRGPQVVGLLRTLHSLSPDQIRELEQKAREMKNQGSASHICDDLKMTTPSTSFASRLQVPWLNDRDIAGAASGLWAAAHAALGTGDEMVRPTPEDLVFGFLDGEQRLSLFLDDELGCDSNGCPIAGLMRVADGSDQGGEIYIDKNVVKTPLYSFTLAHEIGHWVLHRRHILRAREQMSLFDETPVQTHTLHRNLQGSQHKLPPEEWQANRFAAHLLMPAEALHAEFTSRYGGPLDFRAQCEADAGFAHLYREKRNYSRRVAQEPRVKGNVFAPPLNELFNVSVLAMSIRLEELGLITDEASTNQSRLAL